MATLEKLLARKATVEKTLRCVAISCKLMAQQNESDIDEFFVIRAGQVQCFETCIESFWKFLKNYLEVLHNLAIGEPSAKKIFQECFRFGVISEDELGILRRAIDARNLSSHIYNEEIIVEICAKIPEYTHSIKLIIDRIKL